MWDWPGRPHSYWVAQRLLEGAFQVAPAGFLFSHDLGDAGSDDHDEGEQVVAIDL